MTTTANPTKTPTPKPVLAGPEPRSHFQLVPLRDIRESKTNPRQHYNEQAMADLVESVRQFGILEPLLVRARDGAATTAKPSSSSFEIISGARRYRAAKAASLTDAPCIVMDVTDEQFLEIQVIENLQRQDLHPLEEAHGFQALMAPPHRQPVEVIAKRLGRSVKYVYDRVRLATGLTKEAKDLLWKGEIDAGHAILLARIPADKQRQAIEMEVGGLFEHEHTLYDPHNEGAHEQPEHNRKAITVRELQAWIDEHVRFEAKDADPMLYPETAKVLETAPAEEKVLPITYEHQLRDDVRDNTTRTFGPMSWTRADGQHGTKTCAHSEMGLVVAGPRRGEAFQVCRAKKECLVHYGKEIRARQKAEKAGQSGTSAAAKLRQQEEQRRKREAAQEAREEQERQTWRKAVPDILAALEDKARTLPTKATGVLAQTVLQNINHKRALNLPGSDADAVVRLAAFRILANEASSEWWGRKEFPKRAKALGIDLAKILKAHEPKPEAQAEPAPKTKKRPTGAIGRGAKA